MKKSIAVMMLLAGPALYGVAQPPAPPHGPSGRPHGHPEKKEVLQELTSYTGQAGDWVANNDYVYDGFYLQTGGSKQLVKFAPPLGEQLKATVKNGSGITVKGVAHTTPDGTAEIRLVSLTAGGKTIMDTATVKPGTPPAEVSLSGNGRLSTLQKGKKGETIGFVLDNKTILRMPPHVVAQLKDSISAGTNIVYTGNKKVARNGEIASGNYTIVHTKNFALNGKEYFVR